MKLTGIFTGHIYPYNIYIYIYMCVCIYSLTFLTVYVIVNHYI